MQLPLSAHLLEPVQRICRYKLLLSAIIKSAPEAETEFTYDSAVLDAVLCLSEIDMPDTKHSLIAAKCEITKILEKVDECKYYI